MNINNIERAALLIAFFTACHKVDCVECRAKCPIPPAGGLGIPYKTCSLDGQCNETALDDSGLDPDNNLTARAKCESNRCRAYYATDNVCLHGDTIKCAKSNNSFGTSTCSHGSWGNCN